MLQRDEVWGLVIAGAIGAGALGLFAYRQLATPKPVAFTVAVANDAPTLVDRETFAEALEVAFVEDGTDAAIAVKDTALEIAWFPCSKAMLDRLLRKQRDALTRQVREASGLSIARLRALGFTQVICDNTRGAKATDDLQPRKPRR